MKTFGDKYDIIRHDDAEYPRKIKSNTIVIVLIIATFLVNTFSDRLLPDTKFSTYFPFGLSLASALACLVLYWLKWRKNNKEQDVILFVAIVLFLLGSYLFYP